MTRNRNTKSNGRNWSQTDIDAVWKKGKEVPGYDKNKNRKDTCNAWISYSDYGKTVEHGEGWEIDHINPISNGGTDNLSNLQPLQWQNNRHKGDNYPNWECAVSAKQ